MKEEVRSKKWFQCSRCLKWYSNEHECSQCEKSHDYVMIELQLLAPKKDDTWTVRVSTPSPAVMAFGKVGRVELIDNQLGSGLVENRSPNWLVVVPRDEIDRGRVLLLDAARKWMDDACARLTAEMEPAAESGKESDE